MSNIAAVQSVNSMLEAKISAVGSPKEMFQTILEEKLGAVSTIETTSSSDSSGSTVDGTAYSELFGSYGTDSLLNSSGLSGWDQLIYGNYANYLAALAEAGDSSSTTSGTNIYDEYIEAASKAYGVPESLIKAVIACESSFDSDAVSSAGAVGLMQLMPATAAGLGVTDSYDPQQNIMGGTKYLSSLIKNFDGDLILALSGYNMGGTRVSNLGITPNSGSESAYDSIPSSVMSYAKKVIQKMAEYGGSV